MVQADSILPSDMEIVWTIGEDLGPPEHTFGRIRDIALAEGAVFAVDGGTRQIRVLSIEDGRHLADIGGGGEGPGEFFRPGQVTVRGEEITVADFGLNRTVTFHRDGNHISTDRVDLDRVVLADWSRFREGRVVGRTPASQRMSASSRELNYSLVSVSPTTRVVDTLVTGRSGSALWVQPDDDRYLHVLQTSFGAQLTWAPIDDTTFMVGDGYAGTLTTWVLRDGSFGVEKLVDIPVHPTEVETADVEEALDRFLEGPGRALPITRRPEVVAPTWKSALRQLRRSPDGTLWAETHPGSDGSEVWLRLGQDGGIEETVVMPPGFRFFASEDSLLAGTTTTELGSTQIRLLRIRPR